MNSKFLFENRYILIDKGLTRYRLFDYGTKYIICEIENDKVGYITQNLTFGIINKLELDVDIVVGTVYNVKEYQFFSDTSDYIQEVLVYDKAIDSRLEMNSILIFLKNSNRYKDNPDFRRNLDISIICEDVSYLKEFFIY
mgnify:CR=1 FL=1